MRRRYRRYVLLGILTTLSGFAGTTYSVKGRLKSYSDKDLTIIDGAGKKQKFQFSRIIRPDSQDLSKLLDKNIEFDVSATGDDASKAGQTIP